MPPVTPSRCGADGRNRHGRAGITTAAECHLWVRRSDLDPVGTLLSEGGVRSTKATSSPLVAGALRRHTGCTGCGVRRAPPVARRSQRAERRHRRPGRRHGRGRDRPWSPVSLGWNFGDGTAAAGGAVTHAFGSAGAFGVTVTATDGVGNASSASRSILITPGPPPPGPPRIRSKVRVTWGVSGKKLFLLRLKVTTSRGAARSSSAATSARARSARSRARARRSAASGDITLFKEVKVSKVRGKKQRKFRAGQRLDLRDHREGPHRQGRALRPEEVEGPERPHPLHSGREEEAALALLT